MTYKIKKDPIQDIPKVQLVFWIIVRLALIGCATYSFVKGGHDNIVMGWEAVFAWIFSHLWDLFQILGNGSFIEEVPPLSQTMLNIVIFLGIVVGSYGKVFENVMFFDKFMHIMTGLGCAIFAYDFAVIIQRKKGECAATLAAIFSIMFALSLAVCWEFYEFLMDTLHGTNLQLTKEGVDTAMYDLSKYRGEYGYLGLVDTMTDMMMNAIGGIVGMIFMIVLRNKGKNKKAQEAEPNEAEE